jgi:predicted dehydrogenase/threonine dehydrogenase-like Zn-dependent dehydrogenase
MKQVMIDLKNGTVRVEDVPIPALQGGGVVVQNHFSVVSSGTDKSLLDLASSSYIGKARKKPDLFKKVVEKARKEGPLAAYEQAMGRLNKPEPVGYSCAGIIVDASDDVPFKKGDRVACAGSGFAVHAEQVFVPENLCVKVPDNVTFKQAAFTTMGSIAMQGVRNAEVTLGSTVAVIGLGLIGNLTVQLLKAAGCKVFGFDINQGKITLAKKVGLDSGAVQSDPHIISLVDSFTHGYGFDAVIITAATDSAEPLRFAGTIARKRAAIVLVGVVGMQIPRDIYYEKELRFIVSCSYGPGRYDRVYEELGVDYPIGFVRWTEKRNMESFLDLVSQGKISLEGLVSHEFSIEDAVKAYALVSGKVSDPYTGVLIRYSAKDEREQPVQMNPLVKKVDGTVGIGVIGAGQFAMSVLFPNLKKVNNVSLIGLCDAVGLNAKAAQDHYGFQYCTSDYHQILKDKSIDAVIVATRNSMHAKLVIEAVQAGKHVLVEKPLAITREELQAVIQAHKEHPDLLIHVGFNRRFAPMTRKIQDFFKNRGGPLLMMYRVNAEHIPKDHWIYDESEGGSRFITELCHFIDFCRCIAGKEISDYSYRTVVSNSLSSHELLENVILNLSFKDGSVATIVYDTIGDASSSKEYIEIIGEGSCAKLTDFKHLELIGKGHSSTSNHYLKTEKGHLEELESFVHNIQQGDSSNNFFDEIVEVTKVTLKER